MIRHLLRYHILRETGWYWAGLVVGATASVVGGYYLTRALLELGAGWAR